MQTLAPIVWLLKMLCRTPSWGAIKAYVAIGFRKIGHDRLAIVAKPSKWQATEFTASLMATDIDFLTQKINQAMRESWEVDPFGFSIRDEKSEIIAGYNRSVLRGSIDTDQLWVHPDHRGRGFGRQLMEAVHDDSRKLACSMATVATLSFQSALGFDQKMECAVDFERQGYEKNSRGIFLSRSF